MAEQESITEFPVNSESASKEAGHWYILHTYSGFEQRVEQMIRELMRSASPGPIGAGRFFPPTKPVTLGIFCT